MICSRSSVMAMPAMTRSYLPVVSAGKSIDDVLNWAKIIDNITVEDVNAAARQALQLKRSVTGILLQKAEAPASATQN